MDIASGALHAYLDPRLSESGQDAAPDAWVLTADAASGTQALELNGNSWKSIRIPPHELTLTSEIAFALKAVARGELQGVGVGDGAGKQLLYIKQGTQTFVDSYVINRQVNVVPVGTYGNFLEPVGLDWLAIHGSTDVIRELILINDRDAGAGTARFDSIELRHTYAYATNNASPSYTQEFESVPTLASWVDPRPGQGNQDALPLVTTGTGTSGNGLRLRGNTWKTLTLPSTLTLTEQTHLRFDANVATRGELQGVGVQTASGTTLLVAIEENQATNVRWMQVVEGRHQPLGVFRTYDIPIGRWWKAAHGANAAATINRLVFTNDNDSLLSLGDATFDHLSLYEKSDIAPAPPAPVVTGPLFYVNDHLGTPLALNDATGSTKWSTQRDPWGQRMNEANLVPGLVQPFELPGQYADSESGLRYKWHRYLDASSGRYLQTDPLGLEGGDDTLYTYAAADPVLLSDPDGQIALLLPVLPALQKRKVSAYEKCE